VEHSCQQCGTEVEDGRPFCPQCRAPQINVLVAVPDAGGGGGLNADEPNAVEDADSAELHSAPNFDRPGAMDSRVAARSAISAGLLGVFIGVIPILGIVLTGALAVYFYRRKSGFVLPAGLGSRLGGAAGVVAFSVNALFIVAVILLHDQKQFLDLMISTFQRFGLNTTDPSIQAGLQSLFTFPTLVMSFFFAVLFGSIGGALASFSLGPGKPRV
jgi:hypothetical protein